MVGIVDLYVLIVDQAGHDLTLSLKSSSSRDRLKPVPWPPLGQSKTGRQT